MKIKVSEKLRTLKGEVFKDGADELTLGLALANILAICKSGGKKRIYLLAEKCFKAKDFEVDATDMALIKQAVATTEIYNNIINGQIEVMLESKEDGK